MTDDSARPLKIGLLLPETEGQMNGETARWPDLLAMTRMAEAVGFDSVWVTDHFIHRSETETRGPWECWSLLSAIAAVTERVEIGPLVLCAGFRNPALLAKMADTVDEISGGRLILGLGAGWNEPEYRAFGYPFDNRVARFEEALTIISGLLRNGHIDFEGRFYQARDCELRPRGPRPSGPPIMIGTTGKRMLELTAKHADQWNVWFSPIDNSVEKLETLLGEVDAACAAVGREPTSLERTAAVKVEVGPHAPSTMSVAPLCGTPAELAAQLRAYAAIGVTHLQVWPEPNTVAGIEAFGRVIEELGRV
ncbi:MAG: LLM class flavin-dependent oxidoreductase [Thermomicrobiales bacterium]|nr:LLM class flavin-dependent oxidoreductase [Thermomicrobiales bacterium]